MEEVIRLDFLAMTGRFILISFLLFVSCCFYGLFFFIRICVFAFQGKEKTSKKMRRMYVTMNMLDSVIEFRSYSASLLIPTSN